MKNRQNGVALVEFALVLPLLLILTFIVTEYSRALYQYNVLTKSVRDAARYLSNQSPETKITEAKNLVVFGSLTNTGVPLAYGLTLDQVPDPEWLPAGTAPVVNTVTIQIGYTTGLASQKYTFRPLFASVFGLNFRNMTFGPIRATMRAPS